MLESTDLRKLQEGELVRAFKGFLEQWASIGDPGNFDDISEFEDLKGFRGFTSGTPFDFDEDMEPEFIGKKRSTAKSDMGNAGTTKGAKGMRMEEMSLDDSPFEFSIEEMFTSDLNRARGKSRGGSKKSRNDLGDFEFDFDDDAIGLMDLDLDFFGDDGPQKRRKKRRKPTNRSRK